MTGSADLAAAPGPVSGDVPGDGVVALVVHRRLAESSFEAYQQWQERVAERLASWPGFLDRRIIRPNPPVQPDWVIVQRFRDVRSARAWLQSPDRAALATEIADHFVGNDEIHLVTENPRDRADVVSALISCRVAPELEPAFLAWQRTISATESRFEGFVGHRVERPIPGVQDDWVVVLSFDSDQHLDAWLTSPQRAELLARGERFNQDVRLVRSSYGFGFWSGHQPAAPDPVFKSNLLVLLMLYPVVFLWGYFVADPLFASHDVPFWLSLFIGNVVSTQLLGWWLVPWAFRRFRWWLRPGRPASVQAAGFLIVGACYALSMAVYAVLLAWR